MALTFKTKVGIVVVVTCCAAIVITLCVVLTKKKDKDEDPKIQGLLECAASQTDEEACKKAGCIWNSPKSIKDNPRNGWNCALPEEPFGFQVVDHKNENGKREATLEVKKGSFFGKDFKKVLMTVTNINKNILRVKFTDADNKRYEVPIPLKTDFPASKEAPLYSFEHTTDSKDTFSFKVTREGTKTVIFDSSIGSLFLADRHIEVSTKLPTKNVYGTGENTHTTFKHDLNYLKWPLFSRDQFPDIELSSGKLNLYGVHPFYTCLEADGKSHGVLFLNSNPMEVLFTPEPTFTFRSAGGILDMFFFVGETPEHVVQLYTEVIGRPMIPPYWSLGFQMSRYGYQSLENMKKAIANTRNAKIPLDVVYADIDHMQDNKDFTWDPKRFPDFPKFIEDEKKKGLRVIIIIDPAILATDKNYPEYKSGEEKDVFVKWPASIKKEDRGYPEGVSIDKDIMYGRVWPNGPVAFPDYFKKVTRDWWQTSITEYRKKVNFDAIWIDMNEPSVFATNLKTAFFCPKEEPECWTLKCPVIGYDSFENTFIPAAVSTHDDSTRLSDKTLCMEAVQGETNQKYVHYDVHSLYGWSQTPSTYEALKKSAKEDQVPLVISRSTYVSSGKHTGHWLGDNKSRWMDLRFSIIGMLEFNLFGIPYIGADICGFFLHTTSELCGRWMQAGAFYPFSRNHNNNEARDQEPGNKDLMLDRDTERSRTAMETRYQLLPYLHTLHYLAHKKGNTVVRPLFHEFPTDEKTHDNHEQFLWGSGLLISPALYEGQTEVKLYLPKDVWYDFHSGAIQESSGETITVKDTEVVPLHVRGGHILPMKKRGALNTKESRGKTFELHVYPKDNKAEGFLFWMSEKAKGDAYDVTYHSTYDFEYSNNQLTLKAISVSAMRDPGQKFEDIFIYGIKESPKSVKLGTQSLTPKYDDKTKILQISASVDLKAAGDSAKFDLEF